MKMRMKTGIDTVACDSRKGKTAIITMINSENAAQAGKTNTLNARPILRRSKRYR